MTPKTADFASVLSSGIWRTAVLNTILECVCSTGLSVLCGYIFAYAVVRGDIPFKKFFALFPVIHLMTPPFVGGLAFILLFGRQGFVTHTVLGLDVSLYGFWGLLFSQVLCFFPIAFLICMQSLKSINPELEQAAKGMGASRTRIFFTITLPLSFPGILSSLLFIAVSVLSDFGNPLIVGGRFRVLAVEIYTQLTGWLNAGTSAVLGLMLVIPSVVLFVLQNKVYKKNLPKTATIGGKNSLLVARKSSDAMKILLTIFCLVITILIFVQIVAVVAGSFQKLWSVNTDFTLNHIKAMRKYIPELRNSIVFAFVSAVISTFIAAVSSYFVHRTSLPMKKFIDVFIQLPSAIPGSLFGLALSLTASKLKFHSSVVLIIVAMTVSFMPFSYRILSTSFGLIKTTIDDSAKVLGSGILRTFSSVIVPISSSGIFSAFLYDFVRGVGTLSSVIFLVSFGTPLSSVRIMNLAEQGDWGKAACLALILTVVSFLILSAGQIVLKAGKKINKR